MKIKDNINNLHINFCKQLIKTFCNECLFNTIFTFTIKQYQEFELGVV